MASHQDEDDDYLDDFGPVLAQIQLDKLPDLARSVRHALNSDQSKAPKDTKAWAGGCSIISPPLTGSYHILFQVKFDDGIRWLLKVPATAYCGRWDDKTAAALRAEALTMQLLGRETDIPVPRYIGLRHPWITALDVLSF